jgi:hypothetical protein
MMGKKFGRLIVVARAPNARNRQAEWYCKCDCGTEDVRMNGSSLRSGHTISCGCVHSEVCAKMLTKHGHAAGELSGTYITWESIKGRCLNPNNPSFDRYGGRGIAICRNWKDSYPNFLESMGEKPSEKHSIDRINNSGNYSCGKCDECVANGWPLNTRWATQTQQARNKSNNRILTINGVRKCLAEWAAETGMRCGTISERLKRGWTDEAAVFTPAKPSRWLERS